MARPLDDPDRMGHMLESAEKALRLARGRKRADFDQDELLQLALTRLVEMIGEAASRVTQHTRDRHRELPWGDVIGTRNRIVHDYYLVNLDILWQIVTHDLRPLVESLKRILAPKQKSRRSPKKR